MRLSPCNRGAYYELIARHRKRAFCMRKNSPQYGALSAHPAAAKRSRFLSAAGMKALAEARRRLAVHGLSRAHSRPHAARRVKIGDVNRYHAAQEDGQAYGALAYARVIASLQQHHDGNAQHEPRR